MENKNTVSDEIEIPHAFLVMAEEDERLFNLINSSLESAREWGLETEFVFSALSALKKNPDMSIDDAVYEGLAEWDI